MKKKKEKTWIYKNLGSSAAAQTVNKGGMRQQRRPKLNHSLYLSILYYSSLILQHGYNFMCSCPSHLTDI